MRRYLCSIQKRHSEQMVHAELEPVLDGANYWMHQPIKEALQRAAMPVRIATDPIIPGWKCTINIRYFLTESE